SVMPSFGLGTSLKSGKLVPSAQYFNLASWHTINNAYTRKAWAHLTDVRAEAGERDKLDLLLKLVEQRAGHWLAMQVEQAKIDLSEAQNACIDLSRVVPDQAIAVQREDFDQSVDKLVDRVQETVSALLKDAGVAPGQIDTVFFTGGSSRVPLLRTRVAEI